MDITLKQAEALVGFFGGDNETVLSLIKGDDSFHAGEGLYVYKEYPEHGCIFLGNTKFAVNEVLKVKGSKFRIESIGKYMMKLRLISDNEGQQMEIKCNKCGYVGDEQEFPKGRDFLQKEYIKSCPKCDNYQDYGIGNPAGFQTAGKLDTTPGGASMRMMSGVEHPFEYIRKVPKKRSTLDKTLHQASEVS